MADSFLTKLAIRWFGVPERLPIGQPCTGCMPKTAARFTDAACHRSVPLHRGRYAATVPPARNRITALPSDIRRRVKPLRHSVEGNDRDRARGLAFVIGEA